MTALGSIAVLETGIPLSTVGHSFVTDLLRIKSPRKTQKAVRRDGTPCSEILYIDNKQSTQYNFCSCNKWLKCWHDIYFHFILLAGCFFQRIFIEKGGLAGIGATGVKGFAQGPNGGATMLTQGFELMTFRSQVWCGIPLSHAQKLDV